MRAAILVPFLGLWVLAMAPACGSAGDKTSVETPAPVGTLRLSLTGVSNSGVSYRLRSGIFMVEGPEDVELVTEDDPDASSLRAELPAGSYIITLTDDWFLEREVNGAFAPVRAVLVSPNPVGFTISDQGVTGVVFRFRAGEDVVEVGNGTLDVSIAVDDVTCGSGTTQCGTACVTLESDPFNCGACANVCMPESGQMTGVCVSGVCVTGCHPDQTDCGGFCSDLETDPFNCGACANVCPPAPGQMAGVCVAGACAEGCATGQVQCPGSCVNLQTDSFNCGACGVVCPPQPGQMIGTCASGVCQ